MDKKFGFFMPIVKDIDGKEDGIYRIKLGVASGLKDKQDDKLSDKFLKSIMEQIKGTSVDGTKLPGVNADDNHKSGLKSIVGTVEDSWIEKEKVMAAIAISDEWEDTIKSLIKIKAPLGGSIQGKASGKNEAGEIDGGFISKIAITDTPAAWDLRGTAEECTMCQQISKTLKLEKAVTFNEDDSYEGLADSLRVAINDEYSFGDRTKFWVRRTWNDVVIVDSYDDDKHYAIPYTRDADGNISLSEPKEVDTQWIEKKARFYNDMIKSNTDIDINDTLNELNDIIVDGIEVIKELRS